MSPFVTFQLPPSSFSSWPPAASSSSSSILGFTALPLLLLRRLAALPGSAFFRGVFGVCGLLSPFSVGLVPVAAAAFWVSGVPPVTCLPFSSLNPAFSTMDLKRRCLVQQRVSFALDSLKIRESRIANVSYALLAVLISKSWAMSGQRGVNSEFLITVRR